MNTSPTAQTILCYGDSNTWGQTPDKTGHRYAANIRWTGVLQSGLGGSYYVIEEGLSSRTTDLDYNNKPGRNGRTYLEPCLDSQAPLDAVILMLGTNDLKIEFDRTAEDIAKAVQSLVELIQAKTAKYTGQSAKILLVSPILVDSSAPRHKEWYSDYYDEASAAKSKALSSQMQAVAQNLGCDFFDAATVARAGEDGIHLDQESHNRLGTALTKQVKILLG